jgi:hypothetical protein
VRPGMLVSVGLLATALPATAQQPFELRGRVIDAVSSAPLDGAVVRLPAVNVYTITDAQGLFRFAGVRTGTYLLEVVQLGYGEQSFRVTALPDSFFVLRAESRPTRLDTIFVDSRIMHRTAQRRAQQLGNYGRRAVFWEAFDREQILATGIDDPLEFLDEGRGAGLSITTCFGPGMEGRLCLRVPFLTGRYFRPAPQTGLRYGGQRSALDRDRATAPTSGPKVQARVFLDDRRIVLEDLSAHTMQDIGRVETYGFRGEEQIRLYTTGYLRKVALGLVAPDLTAPRLSDVFHGIGISIDSVYRPPLPPDSMRWR